MNTICLSDCVVCLLSGCSGVKILHYSIPRMVDCTNTTSVTLDCLYSYDPGDVKLVVRWFHNDSPEPIYQWIPEPDIRYVGELIKPYFDMDFQVSDDRYAKYRALRLNSTRLPVALNGNYSCVISSIANQDTRQSPMVIYGMFESNPIGKCPLPSTHQPARVHSHIAIWCINRSNFTVPPKKFEFRFVEIDKQQLALQCTADGIYPKPVLTFSEQHTSNSTFKNKFPEVNVKVQFDELDSQLYSASFLYRVQSALSAGTIYECRLELPGTYYVRKKRIKIIFPTSKNTLCSFKKRQTFS